MRPLARQCKELRMMGLTDYKSISRDVTQQRSPSYHATRSMIARDARSSARCERQDVLDAGCGHGWYADWMAPNARARAKPLILRILEPQTSLSEAPLARRSANSLAQRSPL